ncbi:MAG: TrkH family potassium uptake protein [Planctomycetota bacterium]
MNLRAVWWLLGCVLLLLSGFMVVPALVAAFYGEKDAFYGCIWAAVVTATAGGLTAYLTRGATVTSEGRADYFRREGLAAVGLAWILGSLAGSLPYLFSGAMTSFVDAIFESASGLTTTGSTILLSAEIDALPRGITFWRSFTHWIGGIGIVLVFVVLFPTGGRSLFRSEVPGVSREAVQSRVRDSAFALMRVYVLMTLVQVVLLVLFGLTIFDSFLHSFGTLATGGFSPHSASVMHFDSIGVEAVIIAFMFAAGINFAIWDLVLRAGVKRAWESAKGSDELRLYVSLILGSTLVVAGILWFWGGSNGDPDSALPDYSSLLASLRDSLFYVVSIQTSTGYGTVDYDQWPDICRLLLMLLATIGACAGSTGGGIKVIRILILGKGALLAIQRFARPRALHSVRVDGRVVEDNTVAMIMGYCALWAFVFAMGTVAVSAFGVSSHPEFVEHDLLTAATSVLATLNNIGPGLSGVGPTQNFAFMPAATKLLMSFFMILGRLEFYAMVVLFVPRFWRH